jgi:hypothetical protein
MQNLCRPAQYLGFGIAKHLLGGRIPVDNPPLRVGHNNSVGQVLKNQSLAAQLQVGLFAPGQVP